MPLVTARFSGFLLTAWYAAACSPGTATLAHRDLSQIPESGGKAGPVTANPFCDLRRSPGIKLKCDNDSARHRASIYSDTDRWARLRLLVVSKRWERPPNKRDVTTRSNEYGRQWNCRSHRRELRRGCFEIG